MPDSFLTVARMKARRAAIREISRKSPAPDCVALHPGYMLNTAQCMRDYHETLEHLNIDAAKITVAEGRERLEILFAPGRSYDWNRLAARLDTLEQQLPERSPFAVAVSQPDMRLGLA